MEKLGIHYRENECKTKIKTKITGTKKEFEGKYDEMLKPIFAFPKSWQNRESLTEIRWPWHR